MRTTRPHAYTPISDADPWTWAPCRHCKHGPGAPIHLLTLPGIVAVPATAPTLFEDEPEEVQPDRTNQLTMF